MVSLHTPCPVAHQRRLAGRGGQACPASSAPPDGTRDRVLETPRPVSDAQYDRLFALDQANNRLVVELGVSGWSSWTGVNTVSYGLNALHAVVVRAPVRRPPGVAREQLLGKKVRRARMLSFRRDAARRVRHVASDGDFCRAASRRDVRRAGGALHELDLEVLRGRSRATFRRRCRELLGNLARFERRVPSACTPDGPGAQQRFRQERTHGGVGRAVRALRLA